MRWSVGDVVIAVVLSILTVVAVLWVIFNIMFYIGVSNAVRVHGADEVHNVSPGVSQEFDSDHDRDRCAKKDYCHLSVEDFRDREGQADYVQDSGNAK